jgi:hypothetical protein
MLWDLLHIAGVAHSAHPSHVAWFPEHRAWFLPDSSRETPATRDGIKGLTHELPSVFTVAERVILLDEEAQTIIASGTPRELHDKSDNPVVYQFCHRSVNVPKPVGQPVLTTSP